MTPLSLPSQTLAWLNHAADAGQRDAQVLLHLIARADKHDQDVAVFVDSYTHTIAALCRRLEALERGAGLRHPVEDAEATQPDTVAAIAQRITDYAVQAGLTVQDWAKAFNATPVDAGPVANALLQAEAALADVAEGEVGRLRSATEKVTWAELRCAKALAAIRPVMKEHGIRTSEFPSAVPAPATPTPSPDAYAEGLAERIEQIFLDKTSTPGGPGLLVPDPEDPLGARLAIREIASSLRSWQCVPSVFNPSAWDAAEWLERQARR
jgi:hypothetical protein